MTIATGQRRDGAPAPAPLPPGAGSLPAAPTMPPDAGEPPAVTVHDPAQAVAALALAGPRGVLLLSAPGAAGGIGIGWFQALVAQAVATARRPDLVHVAVLDCGDAPGLALAALRAGQRDLVLDAACPAFPRVAAAAAEVAARLRPARPPALDLGRLDLRRAAARARLAAWLTAPG